jgi:hypothetical protein
MLAESPFLENKPSFCANRFLKFSVCFCRILTVFESWKLCTKASIIWCGKTPGAYKLRVWQSFINFLKGFFPPSYTSGFSFHFCVETSDIYFVLRGSAYSASVVIFQIYTLGLKWKYHRVRLGSRVLTKSSGFIFFNI